MRCCVHNSFELCLCPEIFRTVEVYIVVICLLNRASGATICEWLMKSSLATVKQRVRNYIYDARHQEIQY